MAHSGMADLDRLEKWSNEIAELSQRNITSRLVEECIAAYKDAMKYLSQNVELPLRTFRQLETSCSSFILWDNGYGVATGHIDEALMTSQRLQRIILEHLISICETLSTRLLPLLDDQDRFGCVSNVLNALADEAKTGQWEEGSENSSEGSEYGFESSSALMSVDWDDIAEDLATDVECLIGLDSMIETPAPDVFRTERPSSHSELELQPCLPFREQIRNRFPRARDTLVDRMAQANLERYFRTTTIRTNNLNHNKDIGKPPKDGGATLPPPSEQTSKFNDSGLGTLSSYAETIMTYRHDGQDSVRIPALPEKAKMGEPFECVACGLQIRVRNNSAWKKHLYLDLQPWLCHIQACSYGKTSFTARQDWVRHLALEHKLEPEWQSFQCPFCFEETGTGEVTITKHLSSHMEDISLSALPISDGDELSSTSSVASVGPQQDGRPSPSHDATGKSGESPTLSEPDSGATTVASESFLAERTQASDNEPAPEALPPSSVPVSGPPPPDKKPTSGPPPPDSNSFQCDMCDYRPRGMRVDLYSVYLKKHIEIHHNDVHYSCSGCGKTFRRKDNLTVHRRTSCPSRAQGAE